MKGEPQQKFSKIRTKNPSFPRISKSIPQGKPLEPVDIQHVTTSYWASADFFGKYDVIDELHCKKEKKVNRHLECIVISRKFRHVDNRTAYK